MGDSHKTLRFHNNKHANTEITYIVIPIYMNIISSMTHALMVSSIFKGWTPKEEKDRQKLAISL